MIDLEVHPQGTILPVRARAAAGRNEIRGHKDGMLRVCVTQVAEKGKANKALIAVLSRGLRLRKSRIELIAGRTAREKRFLVQDVTPAELARRIEELLGEQQ